MLQTKALIRIKFSFQSGGNPGRTANKCREHLRAVLSWAWEQKLIETLPKFSQTKKQRDVAAAADSFSGGTGFGERSEFRNQKMILTTQTYSQKIFELSLFSKHRLG